MNPTYKMRRMKKLTSSRQETRRLHNRRVILHQCYDGQYTLICKAFARDFEGKSGVRQESITLSEDALVAAACLTMRMVNRSHDNNQESKLYRVREGLFKAIRLQVDTVDDIYKEFGYGIDPADGQVKVGDIAVSIGDWIVKGPQGVYVMKHDLFTELFRGNNR